MPLPRLLHDAFTLRTRRRQLSLRPRHHRIQKAARDSGLGVVKTPRLEPDTRQELADALAVPDSEGGMAEFVDDRVAAPT